MSNGRRLSRRQSYVINKYILVRLSFCNLRYDFLYDRKCQGEFP